jgi:hypothetical protein
VKQTCHHCVHALVVLAACNFLLILPAILLNRDAVKKEYDEYMARKRTPQKCGKRPNQGAGEC